MIQYKKPLHSQSYIEISSKSTCIKGYLVSFLKLWMLSLLIFCLIGPYSPRAEGAEVSKVDILPNLYPDGDRKNYITLYSERPDGMDQLRKLEIQILPNGRVYYATKPINKKNSIQLGQAIVEAAKADKITAKMERLHKTAIDAAAVIDEDIRRNYNMNDSISNRRNLDQLIPKLRVDVATAALEAAKAHKRLADIINTLANQGSIVALVQNSNPANPSLFVMDKEKNIYVKIDPPNNFRHSTFDPISGVVSAGEIGIKGGKIDWISNDSGHYHPSSIHLDALYGSLKEKVETWGAMRLEKAPVSGLQESLILQHLELMPMEKP